MAGPGQPSGSGGDGARETNAYAHMGSHRRFNLDRPVGKADTGLLVHSYLRAEDNDHRGVNAGS